MVIIITGASHTGKTNLAQKMMEQYRIPYVSQDHIKMGLIRSGNTTLTPADDGQLTEYLWPITREMIKTAIENHQNLIVEGCYCPFDWKNDLEEVYKKEIRFLCICFSETYIANHFNEIKGYASCIEQRIDDSFCTKETLLRDNIFYAQGCRANGLPYVLIRDNYREEIDLALKNFEFADGKEMQNKLGK